MRRLLTLLACSLLAISLLAIGPAPSSAADWPQLQGGPLRSGDAPTETLGESLGLIGSTPLSDAALAAPVVSDGRAFVIDSSGLVHAIDLQTLQVVWRFQTEGGPANCNNVAAPAVAGQFVHVGTMAGYYYVLDRDSGEVRRRLDCGEPVFAAPAVGSDRVYFATLGAQVRALRYDGTQVWKWSTLR